MKKRIFINARYAEEKRVAILEAETLADFYVEVSAKEHLKGNIYKATVVRVEPGLQAAFVDFGPKKHGFLQLREISPEYMKGQGEGKRSRVQDVLSKGMELIVQVEKDERDTKGASLTTYISIPGRYLVMMPGQKRVGISRKIESREDRERLRDAFNALKLPKDMGFILRTAGSDSTVEELNNDLKYLTKLWTKIQKEAEKASAPALIYKEHDIAVRTVRDYLTSDVTEVFVDNQEAYKNTKDFLKKTLPWRKINIKYYKDPVPLFTRYGIEEQIAKNNERYIYLPSRGYIVFDKSEALTAIDVNSGRSRKEGNIEATALRTNLEAADELARQLRLRDIGGLIVIDFIDMESSKNRRDVENRLRTALATDKAHWDTSGISKFGIVEMTRERMRPTYFESLYRKCEACDGAGTVKTDEMVAISAMREIHALASKGGMKAVHCALPVESANYLINNKREEIALLEKELAIRIVLKTDKNLLPGNLVVEAEKPETSEPGGTREHPRHEQKPHPEHKPEHKPEHRPEHRPEHKPEHKAGHEAAQRPEGKSPRKRRRRKRGEHRPEHEAVLAHGHRPGAEPGQMPEPEHTPEPVAEREQMPEQAHTPEPEHVPAPEQMVEREAEKKPEGEPKGRPRRRRGSRRGSKPAPPASEQGETKEPAQE